MSDHILKRHNKNCLLYHLVCPSKYRRKVFTDSVEKTLKEICFGISERYEIHFVEIGADEDHVHFLVQSVPMMLISKIVRIIKSITAREIFTLHPEVKEILWGGHFWTTGYYINTVSLTSNESVIKDYIRSQGKTYKQFHRGQPTLFDWIP